MLSTKRVIIFSTAYLPWVGGAEIAVKEITDRNLDVHFDLITVNLSGSEYAVEKVGNVTVHRLGNGKLSKFFLPFTGYLKAKQLHKKQSYDLAWGIMASQASVAGALFKKFCRVPFVLTLQEGDEEEHLKRYVLGSELLYNLTVLPLHRFPIKLADRITVISNYLKGRAEKAGARCPIEIIPNGVDLSLFNKAFSDNELWTIKTALGKTDGEKFVITTSRLVKKNGVGDLISAMQFLPANIRLLVLGVGELQAKLLAQVKKLNLENRVRFLGHVPYAEIPKYLRISDVFVRPSLSEGMGNSFIEAMAAGIPIVGTNIGGIPDFLEDGVTGLMAEVGNAKSISLQVNKILSNSELAKMLTENARKKIASTYEWEKIALEMRQAFEKTS